MKSYSRQIRNVIMAGIFLLILSAGIYVSESAKAYNTVTGWLDTSSSPTLTQEWSYPAGSYSSAMTDNSGCESTTVRLSATDSTTACMVRVQSGYIGGGYYQPDNSFTGGTLSGTPNLLGIPGTDEGYWASSDYTGNSKLEMYPGIHALVLADITTGNQSYRVGSNPSAFTLADKSGAAMYVDPDTISFSANGKWMVLYDLSAELFVKVNLQTMDVIPFAPGTNYPHSTTTAISNDGRYAAVHDPGTSFNIYDTSTCGTPPQHITNTSLTCGASRDIQSYISSGVPGYTEASKIRFVTDNLITIKVFAGKSIYQYDISAPGLTAGTLQYLALGDSYSSGEGAGDYEQGTDDASYNSCHNSVNSWPDLIAQQLSYSSSAMKTIACSGAITANVVDIGKSGGLAADGVQYPVAPINNILGNWLPGLELQQEHVGDTLPHIMTITMGGNDIGFSTIAFKCVVGAGNCYSSYYDRLRLVDSIDYEFSSWYIMYSNLIDEAGPGSRLYVVGYPQIVGEGDCPDNVRLSAKDIAFARELISYLDYVIEQAANNAGAIYVDTQDSLNGYEMCQKDNTDAAINGLTFDYSNDPFISSDSYHPNKLGQQLIAQSVLSSTENFTVLANKTSVANIHTPSSNDDQNTHPELRAMLDVPKPPTQNPIPEPIQNSKGTVIGGVYVKGGQVNYKVSGIDNGLRPNTAYTATLHSDPVTLGTFTTDANGDLNVSAPVPDGLEPGLHMIDITGPNVSGEAMDLYDSVYVDSPPANLVTTSPAYQTPAFSWDAVSGATGYNIYRGGTMIGSSPTNSYTDVNAPTGTNSYFVTATFDIGVSSQSNTLDVVVGSPPAITSEASTSVGMRAPFDFPVTTDGSPTATLTESGALPSGVNFTDNGDGTGDLSGIAPSGSAGDYPITITASNGVGSPVTQSFVFSVTSATSAPEISSDSSETGTFGVPLSFTLSTNGYPAPKLTRTGALPPGVTFTDNGDGTATMAGTPAAWAVGVYFLTIKAKSTTGTVTQVFTLTITKAPVLKKISNKTARVGTAFSMTITAKGYTIPALLESGTLPEGLSFADNGNGTATITGTPSNGSGGLYPVNVTATNLLGSSNQTFTLKVNEAPAITSAPAAGATIGSAFSSQVTATGYPHPSISKIGALPKGVTFKASTGTFSGSPKPGTAGNYPITITAKNSSGTVTQSFVLSVK